jgi:hypothetical protein
MVVLHVVQSHRVVLHTLFNTKLEGACLPSAGAALEDILVQQQSRVTAVTVEQEHPKIGRLICSSLKGNALLT